MADLVMLPDVELMLIDHLKDLPEIDALDALVVGERFGDSIKPWAVVTEIDEEDRGHNLTYLTEHMIQIDCYAGSTAAKAHRAHKEVNDLARTIHAAVKALEGSQLGGYVVNYVSVSLGIRMADPDGFEPARQRRVITAEVTLHP